MSLLRATEDERLPVSNLSSKYGHKVTYMRHLTSAAEPPLAPQLSSPCSTLPPLLTSSIGALSSAFQDDPVSTATGAAAPAPQAME